MVTRRLGPPVHPHVNALHSQFFLHCFPLPRNFWKSIYSVHVPSASRPYLCLQNLRRSRSWLSDISTLVVLSLIVKTQTQAISPVNGTTAAQSASKARHETQEMRTEKQIPHQGQKLREDTCLIRHIQVLYEDSDLNRPLRSKDGNEVHTDTHVWPRWETVNSFRSSKYFCFRQRTTPWGCNSLSRSAACPIKANLKLQHLENCLDTPVSQIFWFLRF